MSFSGHLLDVKSWLMSEVSSRQCAAESYKTQDRVSFGSSGTNGCHFHSEQRTFLPVQNRAGIIWSLISKVMLYCYLLLITIYNQ